MCRLAAEALDCPDREPQASRNPIVRYRPVSGHVRVAASMMLYLWRGYLIGRSG